MDNSICILAYTSSKSVERWRCSYKICPAKIFIQNGNIIKRHGMYQHFILIKYIIIKLIYLVIISEF